MDVIKLTEREEEVMNFMWEYGKPVTSNDILELCKKRTWRDSYLLIMLRSLEKKGAIKICGRVQYNTQYARLLKPALNKEQYYIQLAFKRGVDKKRFVQLAVSELYNSDKKDVEELIASLTDIANGSPVVEAE